VPTNAPGRRLRIGIVAHGVHDDGGMERAMAELIRRVHTDYDVTVLSSELSPDLQRLVTWKRIPVPRKPAPARFLLFYVLAGLRLARARLDVVHSLGAIVPQHLDVVTVQCCNAAYRSATRGNEDERPPLRRLNTAVARLLWVLGERWSYRPTRARVLAAVSAGAARDLRKHYPGLETLVIPNGVDTDRFHPDEAVRREVRAELGVSQAHFVSLFVGGDWFRKGLATAVEAVAEADRRLNGRAAELWVVGSGDEARVAALARSLGVEQRIRFFGFRRDAERLYQAADVFLFPTAYESFSLAMLEAAASGLPLVVPPVNGVDELLGDGAGGLVVEPEASSMAAALVRLAHDHELRRRLGREARRRAVTFTWDRVAADVRRVYDDVLAEAA
jgi:UDP-glucose:(heptosyl)LPS alpha-1,3-glucosyltransferase